MQRSYDLAGNLELFVEPSRTLKGPFDEYLRQAIHLTAYR